MRQLSPFRRVALRPSAVTVRHLLYLLPVLAPTPRISALVRQRTLPFYVASADLSSPQRRLFTTYDNNIVSATTPNSLHRTGGGTADEIACNESHQRDLTGGVIDGDDDDDMTVQIYRPHTSPADAERKLKTELFLCLLLTLSRPQDWKDMLTASFRAATWCPHHLDAVLRGVLLNKYNTPKAYLLSCGEHASSVHATANLREAAVHASQAAPPTSTPTSRLHRAKDILVFCAEEGVLYAGCSSPDAMEDKGRAKTAPNTTSSDAATTAASAMLLNSVDAFAPSPAAVHHLLAVLLQAAQRGAEYNTSLPVNPERAAALPTAAYADVWHFLAWMELHGYHILSYAVVDALEAAVDEDGGSPRPQNISSAGSSSTTASSISPTAAPSSDSGSLQYALVSQRIHRLDYLRAERALLREALRNQSKISGDPDTFAGQRSDSHKRQSDVPRTDPAT
jgi:hypothetical protein